MNLYEFTSFGPKQAAYARCFILHKTLITTRDLAYVKIYCDASDPHFHVNDVKSGILHRSAKGML